MPDSPGTLSARAEAERARADAARAKAEAVWAKAEADRMLAEAQAAAAEAHKHQAELVQAKSRHDAEELQRQEELSKRRAELAAAAEKVAEDAEKAKRAAAKAKALEAETKQSMERLAAERRVAEAAAAVVEEARAVAATQKAKLDEELAARERRVREENDALELRRAKILAEAEIAEAATRAALEQDRRSKELREAAMTERKKVADELHAARVEAETSRAWVRKQQEELTARMRAASSSPSPSLSPGLSGRGGSSPGLFRGSADRGDALQRLLRPPLGLSGLRGGSSGDRGGGRRRRRRRRGGFVVAESVADPARAVARVPGVGRVAVPVRDSLERSGCGLPGGRGLVARGVSEARTEVLPYLRTFVDCNSRKKILVLSFIRRVESIAADVFTQLSPACTSFWYQIPRSLACFDRSAIAPLA